MLLQRSRHTKIAVWAAAVWAVGGCAQVDPAPDYERAARLVETATGEANGYRPDEEADVAARIEEFLRDGVTADEAVQMALLNDPSLQGAYYDVGMARAELVQSGLFSNPTLAFSAQFPEGGGRSNLQASLAQNLADLWQIPARRRAAERSLDAAILRLASRAAQACVQARSAYFEARAADDALAIAAENLRVAERLLETTTQRQQAGAVGLLDVNLARGTVLSAELERQRARLEASAARRRLATRLGLIIDADALILATPLPEPPRLTLDVAAVVALAREARLDLRASEQEVFAAAARVEQEWRAVWPNVSLGPALERNERRAPPGRDVAADLARASVARGELTAPEIESPGQRRAARSLEIDAILGPSLTMTLPLFDQNQAQIAKARYAWRQAARWRDALERSIVQEARQALDQLHVAWDVCAFYQDRLLPQAETNLGLSQESYRSGRTGIIVVLEAQRALLATRREIVAARRAAAVALAELERVAARPAAVLLSATAATQSAPASAPTTQPIREDAP